MNPFRYDATIYYKTMPERVTKEEFERKQSEMERKSQMILDTYNNAPDNAREMFIELYRDKATDRRFVDDYIDLIRENGHTTIGFNYLVMVARGNRGHQRKYYYNNSENQFLPALNKYSGCGQDVPETGGTETV